MALARTGSVAVMSSSGPAPAPAPKSSSSTPTSTPAPAPASTATSISTPTPTPTPALASTTPSTATAEPTTVSEPESLPSKMTDISDAAPNGTPDAPVSGPSADSAGRNGPPPAPDTAAQDATADAPATALDTVMEDHHTTVAPHSPAARPSPMETETDAEAAPPTLPSPAPTNAAAVAAAATAAAVAAAAAAAAGATESSGSVTPVGSPPEMLSRPGSTNVTFASSSYTPPDRSLPDRAVTSSSIDEAYITFILYCNPVFPLDTDVTQLRVAFCSPPQSEGQTFDMWRLYQLYGDLMHRHIKTWTDLVRAWGVRMPTEGQSTQKVQQYSSRLKRWMHSLHIDAFFDYLYSREHPYYLTIPAPGHPSPPEGRDGVPKDDDQALRALNQNSRSRRGRQRIEIGGAPLILQYQSHGHGHGVGHSQTPSAATSPGTHHAYQTHYPHQQQQQQHQHYNQQQHHNFHPSAHSPTIGTDGADMLPSIHSAASTPTPSSAASTFSAWRLISFNGAGSRKRPRVDTSALPSSIDNTPATATSSRFSLHSASTPTGPGGGITTNGAGTGTVLADRSGSTAGAGSPLVWVHSESSRNGTSSAAAEARARHPLSAIEPSTSSAALGGGPRARPVATPVSALEPGSVCFRRAANLAAAAAAAAASASATSGDGGVGGADGPPSSEGANGNHHRPATPPSPAPPTGPDGAGKSGRFLTFALSKGGTDGGGGAGAGGAVGGVSSPPAAQNVRAGAYPSALPGFHPTNTTAGTGTGVVKTAPMLRLASPTGGSGGAGGHAMSPPGPAHARSGLARPPYLSVTAPPGLPFGLPPTPAQPFCPSPAGVNGSANGTSGASTTATTTAATTNNTNAFASNSNTSSTSATPDAAPGATPTPTSAAAMAAATGAAGAAAGGMGVPPSPAYPSSYFSPHFRFPVGVGANGVPGGSGGGGSGFGPGSHVPFGQPSQHSQQQQQHGLHQHHGSVSSVAGFVPHPPNNSVASTPHGGGAPPPGGPGVGVGFWGMGITPTTGGPAGGASGATGPIGQTVSGTYPPSYSALENALAADLARAEYHPPASSSAGVPAGTATAGTATGTGPAATTLNPAEARALAKTVLARLRGPEFPDSGEGDAGWRIAAAAWLDLSTWFGGPVPVWHPSVRRKVVRCVVGGETAVEKGNVEEGEREGEKEGKEGERRGDGHEKDGETDVVMADPDDRPAPASGEAAHSKGVASGEKGGGKEPESGSGPGGPGPAPAPAPVPTWTLEWTTGLGAATATVVLDRLVIEDRAGRPLPPPDYSVAPEVSNLDLWRLRMLRSLFEDQ